MYAYLRVCAGCTHQKHERRGYLFTDGVVHTRVQEYLCQPGGPQALLGGRRTGDQHGVHQQQHSGTLRQDTSRRALTASKSRKPSKSGF